MPAKGTKLTDEHKQALKEGREKAQKEREVEQAEVEARQETEAQTRADAQAEAAAEAEKVRRALLDKAVASPDTKAPGAATHSPTYEPTGESTDQGVAEWGPYSDYQIVTTPYGNYAVEPGYVMFFEEYQFFDDRMKQMRTSHRPVYVWRRHDANHGKTRDEIVRGLPPGARHQIRQPMAEPTV